MGKFLVSVGVGSLILVGWLVSSLTTYNVGPINAHAGPWFADTELAKNGWSQFQSAGCAQCHSILGQQGQSTGPDLTQVGKRWKADQIKKLVRDPQSIFVGTRMPSYPQLSEAQLDQIASYLETLK